MGRPKVIKFCEACEKQCSRKNRFCNTVCAHTFKHTKWVERWLAGKESGARAVVLTSRHVKRYLREVRGENCELCGWNERNLFTQLIPLHLDHIDGDYKNNHPENVRLICPNCHSLTCNYGGANRGHGRPFGVYKRAGSVANGRQVVSKTTDAGSNPATPANQHGKEHSMTFLDVIKDSWKIYNESPHKEIDPNYNGMGQIEDENGNIDEVFSC